MDFVKRGIIGRHYELLSVEGLQKWIVWSRRCALVAPCVGPVLTEPVSGAVPSHFAGVLVAVAEDSRLIALWAGAHCYESNPYRLSFCQSRIACGVAFAV